MATLGETAEGYEPHSNPCIDCGKKLKHKPSVRCRLCWSLFDANRGIKLPSTTGKNNHKWKGDNVGYRALHSWIVRNKPKDNCSSCGSNKNIQAANISGEYKRDINDYEWLCSRCHIYKDGTINNLNKKKEVKNG